MTDNTHFIANYHSHTSRCKHATGTEREYIEHAIDAGIKILGFSDHAPHNFKMPIYVSPIRMSMSELSDYCDTVNKLKDEYEDQIEIHLGLELEYSPTDFEALRKIYIDHGIEYIILGPHFIGDEPLGKYAGRQISKSKQLHAYVEQTIEGLSTGYFTYLAHPDLINFTGDDDIYEFEMTKLCEAALKYDIPLEINLLGISSGRQYPSERFFKIAARTGNKAILGLDAHSPEAYDNQALVQAGYDFANNCGINLIQTVELRSLQ